MIIWSSDTVTLSTICDWVSPGLAKMVYAHFLIKCFSRSIILSDWCCPIQSTLPSSHWRLFSWFSCSWFTCRSSMLISGCTIISLSSSLLTSTCTGSPDCSLSNGLLSSSGRINKVKLSKTTSYHKYFTCFFWFNWFKLQTWLNSNPWFLAPQRDRVLDKANARLASKHLDELKDCPFFLFVLMCHKIRRDGL